MAPGSMIETRTPKGASSFLSASDSDSTAYFVALQIEVDAVMVELEEPHRLGVRERETGGVPPEEMELLPRRGAGGESPKTSLAHSRLPEAKELVDEGLFARKVPIDRARANVRHLRDRRDVAPGRNERSFLCPAPMKTSTARRTSTVRE
jgi:hypothetical protein